MIYVDVGQITGGWPKYWLEASMLAAMAHSRRAADTHRAKCGDLAHRRLAHAHLKTQSGPSHWNISATTAPGTIPMCDIVVQP